MKLTDRINRKIHPLMRYRVALIYRKRLARLRKVHPEFFGCTDASECEKHRRLWSRLLPGVDCGWFEMLSFFSGRADFRFVPEDVFYCIIERCLNDCNAIGAAIDDKIESELYIPHELRPPRILAYRRGVFFDEEGMAISCEAAKEILSRNNEEIVAKPAVASSGGSDVHCFKPGELSIDMIISRSSYIVQKRVLQEPVIAAFNPESLNTCRLITFRRPWSGEVSVIAGMLRMGCSDGITDNVSSGGVCVCLSKDGVLSSKGLDHEFNVLYKHPRTGILFSGIQVPNYSAMCKAVCRVAKRVSAFNLLGFDVVVKPDGQPCIIEVNASSLAMLKLETQSPLFGDETERIVDWCEANRFLDQFDHFRTFY